MNASLERHSIFIRLTSGLVEFARLLNVFLFANTPLFLFFLTGFRAEKRVSANYSDNCKRHRDDVLSLFMCLERGKVQTKPLPRTGISIFIRLCVIAQMNLILVFLSVSAITHL